MFLNPLILKPKTLLEEKTYQLLEQLNITTAEQIDLDYICKYFNIEISYSNLRSFSIKLPSNKYQININYSLSENEKREKIAHELGHILFHTGNQFFMKNDFIKLQESQTNHFAGYLLVPFFMFNRIELPELPEQAIYYISKKFNITMGLSKRKYEQLMSRQYQYRFQFIL